MYSLTYMLCEANKSNRFGSLQFVVGGLNRLVNMMYQNTNSLPDITYAPAYWYVTEIGFIKEPSLEKICFLVLSDMLQRKQRAK